MKLQKLNSLAQSLWATREAKCLSIIRHALDMLRENGSLPETETELNRLFYFYLLTASRTLYPDDEIAPISECNNQPDPNDEARVAREQKRPDFQWIFLDRYESDPHLSSKQFVVECKRLGCPPNSKWILNLNYSQYGIARFRDSEWAYGKLMKSGAMVGYWQSMNEQDVLKEVNEGCAINSLPDLILVGSWNPSGISCLEHSLIRAFKFSPFNLMHLWVDLRP